MYLCQGKFSSKEIDKRPILDYEEEKEGLSMSKNSRLVLAFAGLVVGICLAIFSIFEQNRLESIRGDLNEVSGMFSGGKVIGTEMNKKLDEYGPALQVLLVGGLVLAVIGAGGIFLLKKK